MHGCLWEGDIATWTVKGSTVKHEHNKFFHVHFLGGNQSTDPKLGLGGGRLRFNKVGGAMPPPPNLYPAVQYDTITRHTVTIRIIITIPFTRFCLPFTGPEVLIYKL